LFGTIELAARGVELGNALVDHGLGGLAFGLALVHQVLGGLDIDRRALELRLGLAVLRLQLLGVHAGQNLARADEVAFADQNLADPARRLGRDVDLDRFDAAVAAGEACRQRVGIAVLPVVIAAACNEDGDRGDDATRSDVHLFKTPCGGAHC
jgi:hypothetical protein